MWRTLQWWREEILNYSDDRVTNAFAEGITNKIKVMKRRSYGFGDPMRFWSERRAYLLLCWLSAGGRANQLSKQVVSFKPARALDAPAPRAGSSP